LKLDESLNYSEIAGGPLQGSMSGREMFEPVDLSLGFNWFVKDLYLS